MLGGRRAGYTAARRRLSAGLRVNSVTRVTQGRGYSSLINLRQLPAAQLKIDRSFINDIESNEDAFAIVGAVVNLAHSLGLKVVAEDVETAGQRDILMGMGCDEMQGFYFACPMAARLLLDWFMGNKPDGGVDFSPSAMMEDMPA